MRRSGVFPVLVTLGTVLLIGGPSPASAGIKCWTNGDGVRECGNIVPPEYSQTGHTEHSRSGVKVKVTERAKTPEELEVQRREAALKAKQERLSREKRRKQTAHDHVLLQTFTTEQDLVLARDDKLVVIDSRIGLTENRVQTLRTNLEMLEAQAARQERGGKPVSEKIKKNIAKVKRQIGKNQAYVQAGRREQEALQTQFAADLERFRRLKSGMVKPGDIDTETSSDS